MERHSGNYAKIILCVVFFASVAAPLSQFKVPPMMQQLMVSLDIGLATAGWLMSVFALVGVVLALPAGIIVQRLGLKATGLTALAALFIGSAVGGMSESAAMMLGSRVVEGIGMCLISVMAPAAIATWFPPEKRGIPMGVWASWVPLGSIVMFNLAPVLGGVMGWKAVWWFSAGYSVLLFVLMLLLFRLPREGEVVQPAPPPSHGVAGNPFANGSIWLLGAAFCLFNIMVLSMGTFLPVFMETARAFSPERASSTASIIMIVALFMGPIAGVLSDRIGSRKKVLLAGLLIGVLTACLPFQVETGLIALSLIGVGIAIGMVPAATFSAAPEIMGGPANAGVGMSIVAFGQNIGMFLGPALFGTLAQSQGWGFAGYCLIPVLLLAFLISLLIKVR